ncbi:hypothetical protein LGN07_14185 [Burkholderia cepacia]|uniref:hypothetical protein n=1 Tax=Burkholderia cepacia TaxID=292 RepID=UPI0012D9FAE3|nr:hypothetical protein [Burkholderia cepacia]MCA8119867.1 hypothetical protein [Burkholderia cepacia]
MNDTFAVIVLLATACTDVAVVKIPVIPVVIVILLVLITRMLAGGKIRDYRRPKLLIGMIIGTVILIAWSAFSIWLWSGNSGSPFYF